VDFLLRARTFQLGIALFPVAARPIVVSRQDEKTPFLHLQPTAANAALGFVVLPRNYPVKRHISAQSRDRRVAECAACSWNALRIQAAIDMLQLM
jgi:hypothetical protein